MENNQNPQMMNVPQNTDVQNVGQENMMTQPSLPEVQTGVVDNGEANVVSDDRTTILDPNAGKVANLIKIIAIVILSMTTLTFVGLFIWMMVQYNDVSTDVNAQIKTAVDAAKMEQALEDEAEFAEREKDPYRDFAGPADYGQLSFKYPKTWSVYIASDASKGGDYEAYLNPIEVNPVSANTINALRVTIRDKAFDDVVQEYQRFMENRDANLSVESVTVAGTTANRYTGTIPNTELNGVIVIFKIRDKTAILQTDSMLFVEDFNTLLSTVQFNA